MARNSFFSLDSVHRQAIPGEPLVRIGVFCPIHEFLDEPSSFWAGNAPKTAYAATLPLSRKKNSKKRVLFVLIRERKPNDYVANSSAKAIYWRGEFL